MLNLPNSLALFRVVLAPLFFWLLIGAPFGNIHQSWINYFAALVFVIASVTDFFDGYIARTWKQKTKFGGIFGADANLARQSMGCLFDTDSRVFYYWISRRDG